VRIGSSVVLTIEFGRTFPVAQRPANATMPRIVPTPRRPAAPTPVRWTLSKGAALRPEARAPRSA
jgi:hypothetical protein